MASKLSKIITIIIIVMVVLGAFSFAATFTDNFTTDFKSFYVEYQGQRVLSGLDGITLSTNESVAFGCKYTFGFATKQELDYHVAVKPNKALSDFDIQADGLIYSYHAIEDLSVCFEIEKEADHFYIRPLGGLSDILAMVLDKELVNVESEDGSVFELVVSSADYKINISIIFNIYVAVEGVEIEPIEVIFQ